MQNNSNLFIDEENFLMSDPSEEENFLMYDPSEDPFDLNDNIIDSDDFQNKSYTSNKHLMLDVGLDTEYKDKEILSLQASCRLSLPKHDFKFDFILLNQNYKKSVVSSDFFKKSFKKQAKHRHLFYFFVDFEDCTKPILMQYLFYILYKRYEIFLYKKVKIYLYFYFSPKDLIISLGKNLLYQPLIDMGKKNKFVKKSTIFSRRNIKGILYFDYFDFYSKHDMDVTIELKDMFGLDTYGLKSLIESVGISLESKSSLDDYKAKMDVALKEKTNEFLEYALFDSSVLLKIIDKKVDNNNQILKETFNIKNPDYYFNKFNFPLTVGSLVDAIWHKYFDYVVFKDSDLYKLAFLKFGILNSRHNDYKKNLELFGELKKIKSLQSFYHFREANSNLYEEMVTFLLKKNVFKYEPSQYASIRYLIEITKTNTFLLAMTTGGRTINERPKEAYIKYCADVDLASAYGSQLVKNYYPIGRPRIFAKTPNTTKKLTLGQFLHKNSLKLEKYKMFYILVSGNLTFQQDIIHSKVPNETSSSKIIQNFPELPIDKQVIGGDFLLLRNEIINGVITASTLEILLKVSTSLELKEINNLEVVSALYYYDEDCVFTIEEILNEFLKDKGAFVFDSKKSGAVDTRTFKTFLFPIENIVGTLLEKRSALKRVKNDSNAKSLSNSLKLIINTLWGDFTSIFFRTSNVLASQQVSNSIRNYVWMLSKPLATVMSITDGGAYSLMEVFTFKKNSRKPGLNVLSSYYNMKDNRNLKTHPLGDVDWKYYFHNNISLSDSSAPNLDELAMKEVCAFWKVYELDFCVKLEHKMDRSSIACAYMSKAHYMMRVYDETTKTYTKDIHVIRSFKYNVEIQFLYPMYELLKYILNNQPNFEKNFENTNDFIYYQFKLVKIAQWRLSLYKTNKKPFNYISNLGEDVWPGDVILTEKQFRMWNTHCHITSYSEWKKRARRSLRTKKIQNKFDEIVSVKIDGFETILLNEGFFRFLEAMNKDLYKNREK